MTERPIHEVFGAKAPRTAVVPLEQLLSKKDATAPSWMSSSPAKQNGSPPSEKTAEHKPVLADKIAEAHARGIADGKRQSNAELETTKNQYLDAIAELAEARDHALRPYLRDAVALAVIIARSLMKKEHEANPEAVLASVDEAIASLGIDEPLRLRMGTNAIELVLDHRPELLKQHIELIEDPTLNGAGCIAENARRVVDVTLETQLTAIALSLLEQLEEPAR